MCFVVSSLMVIAVLTTVQSSIGVNGWGNQNKELDDFASWGSQNDELDDLNEWELQNKEDDHNDEFQDDSEYVDNIRDDRGVNDFLNTALSEHNRLRKLQGSPPLQLDLKLNQKAQKYAEVLGKTGTLTPSGDKSVGENLSIANHKLSQAVAIKDAIERWYGENKNVLVWRGSNRLGVGISKFTTGPYTGSWVIVANYSPADNMV